MIRTKPGWRGTRSLVAAAFLLVLAEPLQARQDATPSRVPLAARQDATPSRVPQAARQDTTRSRPTPVAAQQDVTLTRASPADAGMSAAVLDAGVEIYRDAVERGDLMGAVLLVARDGKVVLHEAVGWRDAERRLPMQPNTMLRMASNTKPVIATAVAMLVEQRKLGFDDLVREHVPSFDNYRSGFIRIHHLLSHTSGFRIGTLFVSPLMQASAEHPDAPTLQLEVARFGEVGAVEVPGTSYAYSNPGYNTLGALIEVASGEPLDVYLDRAIYTPLGMHDTYNHELAEKLDGKLERMSSVFYERRDGAWVAGWSPGDAAQVPFVRASGGLISTAWDYAIFCQMFLNGGVYGGARILREETVERMTTPKTDPIGRDARGEPRHYGYGWFVDGDGTYSHTGSDGTFAWIDPERRLIGMVLTQTPRGATMRDRFKALVELAIEPAARR